MVEFPSYLRLAANQSSVLCVQSSTISVSLGERMSSEKSESRSDNVGIVESITKEIRGLFDPYSRVARLYPALLTIAPVIWTLGTIHPELVVGDTEKVITSAITFFGGLTLLASVARSRGKAIEPRLIAAWGGWRSTVLLRHLDNTLDNYTKARYHDQLRKLCPDLVLPTAEEEKRDPANADARYRSATKRLIELRRDKKYSLLHKENALYGFRRNLRGLKPLAIAISCCMAVVSILDFEVGIGWSFSINAILGGMARYWPMCAVTVLNICYAIFLIFLVQDNFVLQAANEYAEALFRTLE